MVKIVNLMLGVFYHNKKREIVSKVFIDEKCKWKSFLKISKISFSVRD